MQTEQAYQIHVPGDRAERGLMYAEACFETVRAVRGAIFRWPAHLARLGQGAAAFGLAAPADAPLYAACLAAAEDAGGDAMVRLTLTGGEAPWGLEQRGEPAVHVQAMAYRQRAGETRLRTMDWPFPLKDRPAKFTADYAESLRALVQWRRAGLATDGAQPLVCSDAHIIGGLSANVLLHRDGCWLTPADGPGVLPGIVRGALIEAGELRPSPCPRSWLADCEAMALINAGAFIRPVAAIDGRALDTAEGMFAPLWRALAGQPGVPA